MITPPTEFSGGGRVDCGLAGTVMRFVPPIAALAAGSVFFDGDEQAYARPLAPLLDALSALGVRVDQVGDSEPGLPFTVHGRPDLAGGSVELDASGSSQFVSGLLLVGARYADGVEIRHVGGMVPSEPYLDMTVAMLRDRGVDVDDSRPGRWRVSPGPIAPLDVVIDPDLSNAAPFLAAAAITGGSVTVPHWPGRPIRPATRSAACWPSSARMLPWCTTRSPPPAPTRSTASSSTSVRPANWCRWWPPWRLLADGTSHIHGVAHIRGHETDRLAALATRAGGASGPTCTKPGTA